MSKFMKSAMTEARELQRYVYTNLWLPKQQSVDDFAIIEAAASIEAMIAEDSAEVAQRGDTPKLNV